nr:MAG TPA: hypothetical protein [Caudoviricetes sp.]
MVKYSIPNDDNKTFRKKVFLRLLDSSELGYVDGATDYCLLLPFADEYGLTQEDKIWLAYLYGLSYSGTTAIRFYVEFPSLASIHPKKLNKFWKEQKETLWFNPDKKYLKNNDQVVEAIKGVYKISHKNIGSYMIPILEQGFDVAYKEIRKNWRFFGPHGAYLFFDALYGLCPELYSDPTHLDWKNCGKTVSEGMAHLLYMDEAIDTKQHDYDRYNRNVDKIAEKSGEPKVIIESTLCAFRKLFKETRYPGYYADRMLEECNATAKILKGIGIDIWDYREKTIPDHLRGELHGWKGIRKNKCKMFLETGEINV